ncbi:Hypothetical protein SRAE_2000109150 [Strongyloides ratti]|uniref:Uncharacterized protein n=1 Tax=Strongyloides ratti TaxID=34506 RepID=A0A090LE52_STRRB|nr:Hypothetical protein SRAE_2000109150 [Strongyloides ratti]CEF66423.1 Hypothetical protein SRAE_2000109150 [Strongyloides ratti]
MTSDELLHANKLYYFFAIPEDNCKKELLELCIIFKAVNSKPEMIIKGYNSTPISLKNIKIDVNKLYYKDEDGVKEVPNLNKTTNGLFSLNEYELLKFFYDWSSTGKNRMITKIFYFAPPQENYIFPLEYILYSSNETVVRPNCSINGYSYGYLYSVYCNKKLVNLDELDANGVAKDGLYRSVILFIHQMLQVSIQL